VDANQTEQFELLKTVIDHMPAALFIKSGQSEDFGTFLHVNKMQVDLLGFSVEQYLGKTDFDLFPREQAEFFLRKDLETFESGELVDITEEELDVPHGRVNLATRKYPIFDRDGAPHYLIGISQDITERIQYGQAIRLREQNMEILLNVAERLLAEPDWQTVMQDALRELGQCNQMRSTWLIGIESQAGEYVTQHLNGWREGGGVPPLNYSISAETMPLLRSLMLGQVAQVSLPEAPPLLRIAMEAQDVASLILAPVLVHGEIWGLIGMASDDVDHSWTDGKFAVVKTLANVLAAYVARDKKDQELQLAESRLRHASQMEALGQLAGGIAHDFNNMLTSILGFTQLAHDQLGENDPVRKDLLEVLHVGQQAAQLSRQMLVLSRKHEVDLAPIDLCEAVRGFDRIFRRPLGANFELITIADDPCWVMANRDQLELVIMNLAINARDAMPSGGKICVSVQQRTISNGILPKGFSAGDYAELVVRDNGQGIPPELIEQVFEPFFTTKKKDKGTGLGLSTTKQVVEEYGGFMQLHSTLGQGSAFHLFFPVTSSARSEATDKALVEAQSGEESILVVEDEATLRNLARRILERLGYRVDVISSGTEAYTLLLEERPAFDLILCDVVMPHMSGPEMVRRLEEEGVHYPVLYMSGYTGNKIDQNGFSMEGCHFLAKPFTRVELAEKIRHALTEMVNVS